MDALPAPLRGIPAACFDTRYRGPVLLMGSAAAGAAKVLARAGAEVVAPPESFFIARRGPMELQQLEPGEIERAEQWGRAAVAHRAARSRRLRMTPSRVRQPLSHRRSPRTERVTCKSNPSLAPSGGPSSSAGR